MWNVVYYMDSDDLDFFDGDVELINDLDQEASSVASWSDATPSDSVPVTLATIHEDIQLLHFSLLFMFAFVFMAYLNRRSR